MDDDLFRIRKAEQINNLWKHSVILIFLTMIIYGWMGYLGIGTDIISSNIGSFNALTYEQSKFWFMTGRIVFGLLLALLLLFVVPLILRGLTEIPYRKLIVMQQMVLLVMMIERIIWIPLFLYLGLDWYASPLSLGIAAAYLTDIPWIIVFFGAISLVQIWIIWFQIKYISALSSIKKRWIWGSVLLLHIFYWLVVASLVFVDIYLLSGWFN